MKTKTPFWAGQALFRQLSGSAGSLCCRTDKYGRIVAIKKPDPTRLFAGKRYLYQHQIRYWSLHWNFLNPSEKAAYTALGDAEDITGYDYYMREKYDTANLYMAPMDNRWVELAYPNKNPTAEEYLHITDDPTYEAWTYINFPLEKISKNLVITKAELWFKYAAEAGFDAEGKIVVSHRIIEPWSENTITYNTRPDLAAVDTDHEFMPAEGEWFCFDVTADINRLISEGVLFYGWCIYFYWHASNGESMSGLRSTWPHDDDHWAYLKLIL